MARLIALRFLTFNFGVCGRMCITAIAPIAVTSTREPFAKNISLEIMPLPNMDPATGIVCLGGAFDPFVPNVLKYETAINLFWNTTFVIGSADQRKKLKQWDVEKNMPEGKTLSYSEFNKYLLTQYL